VISDFYYSRFFIHLTFESDAFNGFYCHNFFRGVLGVYLKRFACICKDPNDHSVDCNYMRIFETKPNIRPDIKMKIKDVPKPYTLYSSQVVERSTVIELVLFGADYQNYVHFFIHSLYEIGRVGLGAKKIRFKLEKVINKDENILVEASHLLRREYGEVFKIVTKKRPIDMRINFLTPCWLTSKGKQLKEFDITPFYLNLLRRIHLLQVWYMGHDNIVVPIFTDEVKTLIPSVIGLSDFVDRTRKSSRQKREMPTGGFVGSFLLKKVSPIAKPYLELGTIIQVGKKTTFGNGKYQLENLNA